MFSDGCFQSAFRVNCKRADVFSYYPPLVLILITLWERHPGKSQTLLSYESGLRSRPRVLRASKIRSLY